MTFETCVLRVDREFARDQRRRWRRAKGKHGRRTTARERRLARVRGLQAWRGERVFVDVLGPPWDRDDHDDDYFYDDDDGDGGDCWRCGGDGWGIVGTTWDNDDPLNDDDGDVQQCECCGGSGRAADCVYW